MRFRIVLFVRRCHRMMIIPLHKSSRSSLSNTSWGGSQHNRLATQDNKPGVILLNDDGLDRMFQGRSYGTYIAADGNRRLWVPERSVTPPLMLMGTLS